MCRCLKHQTFKNTNVIDIFGELCRQKAGWMFVLFAVFAFSLSSLLGTHGRDSSNLCSLHSTLENFLVMRPSALMAKEYHLKMMGLEQGPRTSLMLFANKELIGCRAEASRLQK